MKAAAEEGEKAEEWGVSRRGTEQGILPLSTFANKANHRMLPLPTCLQTLLFPETNMQHFRGVKLGGFLSAVGFSPLTASRRRVMVR